MATAELAERLMTAEEYLLLPDDGISKELIRGRIVPMTVPAPLHGYFCAMLVILLGEFVRPRELGRIICNDAGVITERDPDSVRGPDISYYSYKRLPKGPLPSGYLNVSPDAAFEVRSPSDRWKQIRERVNELLNAGVIVVCVVDPTNQSITVFHQDEAPTTLKMGDTLTLPDILPGFELPLARLFE
jgi:Uma2 family endonuclease